VKKRVCVRMIVVAGCLLALVACGKGGDQAGDKGGAPGPVVLQVNDRAYTTGDLEREIGQELRRLPPEMQQLLASKDGQKQFLDRMLRRELLIQEAEKRKLGEKAEIVEQVANLRRELMVRTLIQDEIGEKIKVEEKEAQEYFTAHSEEFSGDKVRLKHILVRSEAEAKEVLDRLAKKEAFEVVARAVSQDPGSAAKGGELDYLGREQMVPEFARAAFSLKPGELSGVVKTPFGYHVLQLVDRKKGQPATFDQVRGQLQRRLLDEKQSQRFQAWIKELEGAAKVTRDEGLLPVGRLAPAPPQAPPGPAGGSAKPGDKS
jgi:peptidyl-prolyl cis-trans isomerase C